MALPENGAEVMRALDQLRAFYSKMHAEMRDMDNLYNLQFVIKAPQDFPIVIPSTARRQCERMVAHIAAGNLRLYVPPRAEGRKWQQLADRKEKWLRVNYNRLPRLAHRRMMLPPFWGAIKYAVIRGFGAVKSVADPSYLQPEPDHRDGESQEAYAVRTRTWQRMKATGSPIGCVAVDPLILFPDPSGQYVIEDLRMSKDQAEAQLNRKISVTGISSQGVGQQNQVRWTECWTPERKIICINGTEHLNTPNRLGFLPYSYMMPGYGEPNRVQSQFSGLSGGPEMVHKSFLYIVKSVLEEEARRETQLSAILHGTAWRVWTLTKDPNYEGERDEAPVIDVSPGALNTLRGWLLKPVDLGQFPRELFSQLQHIQLTIDDATLPPIARGMQQGENTAYQSQIYLGVARLIMDGTKRAAEYCIEQAMEHWQMIVEYLDEDIEVWGPYRNKWERVKLSAEDLEGGDYALEAELTPNLPQDELARRSQYIKEWQSGAIPWEQLQEQGLGNDDSEEILEKVLRDKAIWSPQVMDAYARQAAEHLGWDVDEVMAAEQERQQRLAGGTGPSPEQVRQLMAQQAAGAGQGLAQPGSAVPVPAGQPGVPQAPAAGGSAQEIDLILRQIARRGVPQPRRAV